MEQKILSAGNNYAELDSYIKDSDVESILLVCDDAYKFLKVKEYFDTAETRLNVKITKFSDFKPNPDYGSVVNGVELFNGEKCGMIIAVGGGSAIDVAKCIKLYAGMDPSKNYLEQEIKPNGVKLLAIPTTAGTGSEATRFAVIYYKGEKQSVTHESIIPTAVLFDESALETLPVYQKKATMMDALCHGIESFWSVNSTEESIGYSAKAIRLIIENKDGYLKNDKESNRKMLEAANIAGKAINITQTTAGHAMCYKLTSLYGIAHGHAAALCVSKLWVFMLDNINKCADPRGVKHLESVFRRIAEAMGVKEPEDAAKMFEEIRAGLELSDPQAKSGDIDGLKNSVNTTRLKNNPVALSVDDIEKIYKQILL